MSKKSKDDTVSKFMSLLDKDIDANPERLIPLTPELLRLAKDLVVDVDVGDINEKLQGEEN
ncbi:MAG TPA: hypothetical protein VLB90_09655 [Pseudomonadales bacterium]|nr:hypothetical protein [Pseudomonadales bacterium]